MNVRNTAVPVLAAFAAALLVGGITTQARAHPGSHGPGDDGAGSSMARTARADAGTAPAGAGGGHRFVHHSGGSCATHRSPTNNTISHCAASVDEYTPNLAAATPDDLSRAQRLFGEVMQFCRSHPTAESLRRAGYQPVHAGASHWSAGWRHPGFDPNSPRAVVTNKEGKVIGVLFNGERDGFPYLGSIPRPHVHGVGHNEMLHVWCTSDSLAQAFTTRNPELKR